MAHQFYCDKEKPVVQTKLGKLRGFFLNGTYIFQGIRYAKAKRFHQPEPVEPWEGVKNALAYGYVCPLMEQDEPSIEVMIPHRYWPMDENCQYLNIWTQSITPGVKKPVMVWLHGGGFFAGSSIEQVAYDGENLSKYGDVVVVSLNHRLNILGYLDLSPFGEEYKNSANAGTADMVAALQWIHDNIEAFGGDPDNVTLFGQSGGGMKVWTLMQTPAADGLFHKGIVQSGYMEHFMDDGETDGTMIVTAMMQELGLKNVKELETVPYAQMAAAFWKVLPAVEKAGGYVGGHPKQNDWYLGEPLRVGFREHAKTIPVMIGTALGEFSFMPALDDEIKNDPEKLDVLFARRYGDKAGEVKRLFAEAYPDKHISDALFVDSLFRAPSMDFALKKAGHTESETYSYLFTYTFPYDGGHIAWHCSEIPFVFHNTDLVPVCNEGEVTDKLEQQLSDAWLNFARTGKPGSALLPDWPACTAEKENCMIFDRTCEVRTNHDHELMQLLRTIPFNRDWFDGEQKVQH